MRALTQSTRTAGPAALLVVLLLALAPAASADIGEKIIQRCTHGESLAGFSPSAYSKALKELSADAEEYTDCASLIQRAELGATGRGGGGVAAVALPATTSEKKAITRAAKTAAPLRLGSAVVRPGVISANIASAISSLPAPLLAVLAMLLAGLLATLANLARNRLRGRSSY